MAPARLVERDMQEEALQQFLSSVRCERFIDYLDPIGETAEEALARRVRWARMTRNDPAHADEAMFLLQHERDLRSVLTRELDAEDAWVEGVSAGQEYGGTHWARESGETTRLPDSPTDSSAEVHEPDEEPTGIMRMEDITLDGPWTDDDPDLAATPIGAVGKPRSAATGPLPTAATVQPGLAQTRGRVRTASPAMRRVSSPTLSATLDMPTIPPLDEIEQRRQQAVTADREATDPSARPTPELARAIAEAASNTEAPTAPRVQDAVATAPATPERSTTAPAKSVQDEEDGLPWVPILAGVGVLLLLGGAAFFLMPGDPPPDRQVSVEPAPPKPVTPKPAPTKPATVASEPTPPEPVVPEPVDAEVPTPPEPVVPAPRQADPEPPTPPAPEPTAPPEPATPPEPVVPDPRPAPAPTPPAPAPTAPEPTPPAPEPTPTPQPPAPEPASTTALGDMKGLWGGTLGADKGFLLRIQAQQGATFSGTVEVLDPSGNAAYKVRGTFADGRVSFSDGAGLSFAGRAGATSMSGTMTKNGESAGSWSVAR